MAGPSPKPTATGSGLAVVQPLWPLASGVPNGRASSHALVEAKGSPMVNRANSCFTTGEPTGLVAHHGERQAGSGLRPKTSSGPVQRLSVSQPETALGIGSSPSRTHQAPRLSTFRTTVLRSLSHASMWDHLVQDPTDGPGSAGTHETPGAAHPPQGPALATSPNSWVSGSPEGGQWR